MILLGEAGTAASEPAVVWTVIISACATVVLLALAKVLPPVVDAFASAFERRRVWRQRNEDARITDLSEQVDYLRGRVFTIELVQRRQDAALMAHAVWDQQIITLAIDAGVAVPPPPPLYPPPE